MRKHLAIMHKSVIEAVLNGHKTVETRFSQHKIVPFGEVGIGDVVYMKPPGEDILGQFRVGKVIFIAGMTKIDIDKIPPNGKLEVDATNRTVTIL